MSLELNCVGMTWYLYPLVLLLNIWEDYSASKSKTKLKLLKRVGDASWQRTWSSKIVKVRRTHGSVGGRQWVRLLSWSPDGSSGPATASSAQGAARTFSGLPCTFLKFKDPRKLLKKIMWVISIDIYHFIN